MMTKRRTLCVAFVAVIAVTFALLFPGGTQMSARDMYDGYYTAETSDFDSYGWKEYVAIYVDNNKIVTVEYNAKNPSGLLKTWDVSYMREMDAVSGTYPSKFSRAYASELINRQGVAGIDVISGATESYATFQVLAEAVITQARKGDKQIAFVPLP